MQEITDPNGNGVKDEKRHLLHIFQRKDTHPHIMQNASHLCKNRHIPYQKKGQHTNSRNTYYNNETIASMLAVKEEEVLNGKLTSFVAAKKLLDAYYDTLK